MKNFRLKSQFIHFLGIALLLLAVLGSLQPASGQTAASVLLTAPDTSQYPVISTTFKLLTPEGDLVRSAQLDEIVLLENDQPRSVDKLEELENGVRFTVAMNEGPTLANKDAGTGLSRFEGIKASLLDWVRTHTEGTPDEFSLYTSYGSLNLDRSAPKTWENALQSYQPDLRNAVPSLKSLADALQSLINNQEEDGKSRALLFITPLPGSAEFAQLEELVNQAITNKIPVSIWLIGPAEYAASDKATQLQKAAESTGGNYTLYSGTETLPSLADWLEPLSVYYRLEYTSGIKSSGDFSLLLKFTRGNIYLESAPVTFNLSILPPNPIFLSPPAQLTRTWVTDENKQSSLVPSIQPIDIMIEFPDGMPRKLEFSRLFVDNKLVDERTSEPFDRFAWDLGSYQETADHELQVIVQDIAGITGETILLPVTVTVEEKPMSWWEKVKVKFTPVSALIGGLAVAMLVGAIIALVRPKKKKGSPHRINPASDPLTQPVNIEGEYILPVHPADASEDWPALRGKGLAPARLIRKSGGFDETAVQKEIPLTGEEVVIGSEGRKADIVLRDPSVSPVHAHLFKDMDGDFRVADSDSLAGTWVNYAPVSAQGIKLDHGDIVQFGRVGYIFELHGAQPRRLRVMPYQEE